MSSRIRTRAGTIAMLATAALVASLQPAWASPGPTAQIDVWPAGASTTHDSASLPSISDDGRVVVFSDLDADASTGESFQHVFARDRITGHTTMVDVGWNGTPSTLTLSDQFDVSSDGRYVAFVSGNDLVPGNPTRACPPDPNWDPAQGDPQPCWQVYVRDVQAGTTTLASATSSGFADGPSVDPRISGDGTRVVFTSAATNFDADDLNQTYDVVLADLAAGTVRRVSTTETGAAGAGTSFSPDVSQDGHTVVFHSAAPGFTSAPGADPSPTADLYVSTDLSVPEPLVTFALGEVSEPSISADGTVVAFSSQYQLDPLVDAGPSTWDVFLYDRTSGVLTSPSAGLGVYADRAQISSDGQHLLFRGGTGTIYVHDRATGAVQVEAVDSDGLAITSGGDSGFSSISGDGRFVAFWVYKSGISHVYVHDRGAPVETATGTGSATTDSEGDGATPLDPVEASVAGSSGLVSITDLGPGTPAPTGYRVLGQQVSITAAPPAPGGYLTITLLIDADAVPPGTAPGDVTLTRNGTVLAACADGADVGPCLVSAAIVGGDLELVAHSPAASVWAALLPEVVTDSEPPTIAIAEPVDGARVTLGSTLTARYSCSDTGGSGLVSCVGDVPSGTPLGTSSVGERTLTVVARDGAGLTSVRTAVYKVVYSVTGFFNLAPPPVVNKIKAGRVVPLLFALDGNRGLDVLAGPPESTAVTCPVRPRTEEVDKYLTAAAPQLTYRASTQRYTAAWPTDRRWRKGSCRDVVLTLRDGSTIRSVVRIG
jgi:Tol biopolymer transport system component